MVFVLKQANFDLAVSLYVQCFSMLGSACDTSLQKPVEQLQKNVPHCESSTEHHTINILNSWRNLCAQADKDRSGTLPASVSGLATAQSWREDGTCDYDGEMCSFKTDLRSDPNTDPHEEERELPARYLQLSGLQTITDS